VKIKRIARRDNSALMSVFLKLPENEMFASGSLPISNESVAEVLKIGLGTGSLETYLHHKFPQMTITIVEMSRPTVEMAKKWFYLEIDERLQVVNEQSE
ncbi:hypothetical protein OSTOST_20250, partial [Ostertagia ostertagi]